MPSRNSPTVNGTLSPQRGKLTKMRPVSVTLTPVGKIEQVFAFHDAMPTGVSVTETGRIFVNFPRWGDKVPFTVGELRDGKVVPYPDSALNQADPQHPDKGFISVQSVVADGLGHLWILDTAAPEFSKPVAGGAKLVAVDLKT